MTAARSAPPWRVALVVTVSVAVALFGLQTMSSSLQKGGGRIYENPACIPETAPKCDGLSDSFVRILAAKRALWDRQTPYDPRLREEVAEYLPAERASVQRFFYPLWTVFLFAPFALMPLAWAATVFTWACSLVFAGALGFLGWSASRRRLPLGVCIGAAALLVTYAPLWQSASYLQQPSLLVGALQAVVCVALLRRWWVLAGIVAALTLFKPQFAAFGVLVVLVALLTRDPSRRGLMAFGATFGCLLAGSFLIDPGWIGGFLDDTNAYDAAAIPISIAEQMGYSRPVVAIASVLSLAVLLAGVAWSRGHDDDDDSTRVIVAYVGACAIALLVVPRLPVLIGAYDHLMLLIPAAVLVGRASRGRTVVPAIVAVAVPMAAIAAKYWLGYSESFLGFADDRFRAINIPIPAGFLYGTQVADYFLQTFALLIMLALSLVMVRPWMIWNRIRPGEARRDTQVAVDKLGTR